MKKIFAFLLSAMLLLCSACSTKSSDKVESDMNISPAESLAPTEQPTINYDEIKIASDITDVHKIVDLFQSCMNGYCGAEIDWTTRYEVPSDSPARNYADCMHKVTNADSVEELRQYLSQYLSKEIIEEYVFDDCFVTLNGELYYPRGSVGTVSYSFDDNARADFNPERSDFAVTVALYGSGDVYCNDCIFLFAVRDGRFVLQSVIDM